jgi:hypothetical protein
VYENFANFFFAEFFIQIFLSRKKSLGLGLCERSIEPGGKDPTIFKSICQQKRPEKEAWGHRTPCCLHREKHAVATAFLLRRAAEWSGVKSTRMLSAAKLSSSSQYTCPNKSTGIVLWRLRKLCSHKLKCFKRQPYHNLLINLLQFWKFLHYCTPNVHKLSKTNLGQSNIVCFSYIPCLNYMYDTVNCTVSLCARNISVRRHKPRKRYKYILFSKFIEVFTNLLYNILSHCHVEKTVHLLFFISFLFVA